MNNLLKNKKKLTIMIIVLLVLVIVAMAIVDIMSRSATNATIEIHVVPLDATVTINSKSYGNNDTYNIKPGDYAVVISKDGFPEYSTNITIAPNDHYNLSHVMKDANGTYDYLANNPDDEQAATAIGDTAWLDYEEQMQKQYPIVNVLPYTDSNGDSDNPNIRFTVSNTVEDSQFAVLVSLNTCSSYSADIYKQNALDWIKSQGFNPDDYKIIFKTLCD